MKVLFYQFISVYCLIKNLLGIPPGLVKKSSFPVGILIQICLITLTTATMLSLILLYITSQIFLFGMDLWLMWKFGKNYGGRLKGQDAQFETPDEKISISVMVILNHNEDNDVIHKRIAEMCKSVHNSFYKLSCTVEKCLGYPYYIKNAVTDNDCVTYTKVNDKEYLTRDEILEHIQKNCMINVINERRLWFARIFTQAVKWNKKSETMKQTAIMLIFRHCLADGVSLIGLLKNFMIREENPEVMKLEAKYNTKPHFSLDDAYIYRNLITSGPDEPKFDIANCERNIAFYVEDEIKYVPLVKKIKSKLGVGFTEILIAGLAASLANLLAKRGKTMDKCQLGVLFRPINEDLVNIVNGTYNYSKITNDSTAVIINIPVTMERESTMLDRIKSVGVEIEKAKYSVDGLMYHAVGNLVHLVPPPILKQAMNYSTNITAFATNVGGLKEGTIGGCEVEAAMSFITFYYETCFRLSIFSKGDRFQLALTMRENILDNRKEAQEVIDSIFTFVDNLSEELQIQ